MKTVVTLERVHSIAATLCWVVVILLVLTVLTFVVRVATPYVISDEWFFVDTLIRPWQNGDLKLGDFFVKRGPADHLNPLYRLIMLMVTAWFHMDFTVEGLVGTCFAVACVYLWFRLIRHAFAGSRRSDMMVKVVALGIAALMFSLNSTEVYSWPLVTCAFIAIFFVSVLYASIPTLLQKRRWGLLALVTFVAFFVDDAYGVLATISVLALLSLLCLQGKLKVSEWWPSILVVCGVGAIYVFLSHVLVPYQGAGQPSRSGLALKPVVSLFATHWRESWKLIAIPAWSAIISPTQLTNVFHTPPLVAAGVATIIVATVCAAHVWFWRRWARAPFTTLSFVAAGLMLFFYFVLAALVIGRLPLFGGFNYLSQARYVQAYTLQFIAMLLMSAQVLSGRPDAYLHKRLQITASVLLVGLAGLYAAAAAREVPYIWAYQVRAAVQVERLANHLDEPLEGCLVNFVAPCDWSLAARTAVFATLERGPYGLFSPVFRERHPRQVPASWNVPSISQNADAPAVRR